MDSRIPRVLISIDSLKDGQLDLIVNSLQAKTLFEVEIKEWEEGSHYISGELIQEILTHFFYLNFLRTYMFFLQTVLFSLVST